MNDEEREEGRKIKVTVKDRRHAHSAADRSSGASSPSRASQRDEPFPARGAAAEAQAAAASPSSPESGAEPAAASAAVPDGGVDETDYLAELQRERADFENYRRRMMREVSASGTRAKASLVEKLLSVLDSFERAIAHGEGGDGVALVFKELKTALGSEGLEEVPAEGVVFDPNVHEAVMSVDDDTVAEPIVKEVYRRGYRFGDQLLRAAMVVVARPPDVSQEVEE